MGITDLVQATLEEAGIPVYRIGIDQPAESYITFQLIHAADRTFSDDENATVEYLFGADIYTRRNHDDLVKTVKTALKEAGFYQVEILAEIYESGTRYNHVPFEFRYMEEI